MTAELKVDYCSREAAEFAVQRWHYSKCLPAGSLVTIGVWEDGKYIGCAIFSRGSNNHIHCPYDLKINEVAELTRVALNNHKTFVTKILKEAMARLKAMCPDLKLLVSYADANQSHLGIIYQAGNWLYTGLGKSTKQFYFKGKWRHQRTASALKLKSKEIYDKLETRKILNKYRYIMPLDKATRKKVLPLSKPYPKNDEGKVSENE